MQVVIPANLVFILFTTPSLLHSAIYLIGYYTCVYIFLTFNHVDNKCIHTIIICHDVGDQLVEECIGSFTTAHIEEQGSSSETLDPCSQSYTSGLNKVMLHIII